MRQQTPDIWRPQSRADRLRRTRWLLLLALMCGFVLLVHPLLHLTSADADSCALCALLHAVQMPVPAACLVLMLLALGRLATDPPRPCLARAASPTTSRAPPSSAE